MNQELKTAAIRQLVLNYAILLPLRIIFYLNPDSLGIEDYMKVVEANIRSQSITVLIFVISTAITLVLALIGRKRNRRMAQLIFIVALVLLGFFIAGLVYAVLSY